MIRAAKMHKSNYYKINIERRSSQQNGKIMQIPNKSNEPKDNFQRIEKKEHKIKINHANKRLVQIPNVGLQITIIEKNIS